MITARQWAEVCQVVGEQHFFCCTERAREEGGHDQNVIVANLNMVQCALNLFCDIYGVLKTKGLKC